MVKRFSNFFFLGITKKNTNRERSKTFSFLSEEMLEREWDPLFTHIRQRDGL